MEEYNGIHTDGEESEITGSEVRQKSDVTIACCCWGDFGGPHKINYVNNLFRATNKHTTILHRFVCFTDIKHPDGFDEGIELIPLKVPVMVGILPKLIFYKPNNGLTGRVLGLDLDIVILDNIDELLTTKEPFIVRHEFRPDRQHLIGGDTVGFDAGFGNELIWERFERDPDKFARQTKMGDERIVYDICLLRKGHPVTFWQHLFPKAFLSYKANIKKQNLAAPPEGAKIISFHGKPKVHECYHVDWVERNWHEL